MSLFGSPTAPLDMLEAAHDSLQGQVTGLLEQVVGADDTIELLEGELRESFQDVEQLQAEDRGWFSLTAWAQQQFSRQGLQFNANIARVMLVMNPLIKRGMMLRTAYIWGQGVSIAARATGDATATEQDVNTVLQEFLDDDSNKTSFTSAQAQEKLERALGTDGNVTLAYFTDRVTGRVQVRSFSFDEMQDVITNPDDRNEPWYYLRQWATKDVIPGSTTTTLVNQTRRELYPALGYQPQVRPRGINGIPINWDAPVLHVKVNDLDGWEWGIGDTYAALPWARMHKDFLTDWARLVRALSRFAWRLSGDKSSKAQKAATALQGVADFNPMTGQSQAGATAYMGPGANLEAIPKTGATIDSESGKPLAAMVASALGVPVTFLLADPGQTGARAVADTLDKPTEFEMNLRRELWTSVIRRTCQYVIEQSVRAPQGALKGTVLRKDASTQTVELAGDTETTIDVVWPDLTGVDVLTAVNAVVQASTMQVVPALVLLRLVLEALDVESIDEILAEVTDDQGNFIDPYAAAATAPQMNPAGTVPPVVPGQEPAAA